jgi:Flp pilus assembly protein TadG
VIKRFRSKRENGQTMVEFALVLPILLMLLLGVIQFGIAFNNYLAVTDAVRAGARQGAVARYLPPGDRCPSVENRVRESADNLDQAKLGVTCASTFVPGEDVTVSASYPYSINILGMVVKSGDLTATTTERVE